MGMVENPRFAVRIVILSVIVPAEMCVSGFGGHIAISVRRSLSQFLSDTLFGLAMVENPGLDAGISTLYLAVPMV